MVVSIYSYCYSIRWNISCIIICLYFLFVNGLHIFFNPFMFEDLSFITKYDLLERGNFRKSQISENIMNPESRPIGQSLFVEKTNMWWHRASGKPGLERIEYVPFSQGGVCCRHNTALPLIKIILLKRKAESAMAENRLTRCLLYEETSRRKSMITVPRTIALKNF